MNRGGSGKAAVPSERVTSVSDGRYLVITGEAPPQENANSQYVATGGKQYVLMPPQDYWNGAVSAAD